MHDPTRRLAARTRLAERWIALATLPFFLIMVGLALLITFFPEVVTFLPDTIRLGGN